MDEIENLLEESLFKMNSMRIAMHSQEQIIMAMQEQIKSLEEKNRRLLMENERLVEAGIHKPLILTRSDIFSFLMS